MNSETAGFVVVDVWKVKPGKEKAIRPILADALDRFQKHPEILSVDYCLADGDPSRYLVVFRYISEAARDAFVATTELIATMETLAEFWDLDEVFVKGPSADLRR
jgi:quinol monooxygenase YgiN